MLQRFMADHSVQFAPSGAQRAKASVNRYRVAVKALYAWAEARWLVERNPTAILRCQRHRGLPPVVLDASRDRATPWFPFVREQRTTRPRACLLHAAHWLPTRRDRGARHCDIDLDARVAVLRKTKGGDPDRVMLSPTLAAILAAHIARCASTWAAVRGWRRRFSTRQVQRIVVARVREAGINKPITAHSLRHSFATASTTPQATSGWSSRRFGTPMSRRPKHTRRLIPCAGARDRGDRVSRCRIERNI
jgi:integrase